MIDFNDEVALRQAERELSDRERIALGGFLLLQGTMKDADLQAYCVSRLTPPSASESLLRRKCAEWLETDPCRAFIYLWKERAKKKGAKGDAEKTETELMLEELSQLSEQTNNLDDKIKIIKTKADIRYKHRGELQNESNSVNYYLPMRCNAKECPLYDQALRRLQAGDKQLKKDIDYDRKEDGTAPMEAGELPRP